jgi:glycosyltransferase involved in cell wall biosynthesis
VHVTGDPQSSCAVTAGPKLSICIATLNRATYLATTLESIVSQARDGLEIVIVDGASTDATPQVVEAFQRGYEHIRYLRLPAKGGVDQDYCRAVGLAKGEYCWLFTDDDILNPGAIDAVWQELHNNYELIIVNAEVRDATLTKVLEPRCLQVEGNREYQPADFERLFSDTATFMSFIGCVVIKRSLWLSRDAASYFGTVFVHVGVLFQAPLPGRALLIGHPYISIRYGNALWAPKSFEISLFKWPDLIWSFPHFSESAKHKVCAREPWRSVTALLIYRARGAFSLTEYRRFLKNRLASPADRLYAKIVAIIPACALNALLIGYLTLLARRRSTPEIRLADLRSSSTYYRRCVSKLFSRQGEKP